MPKKAINFSDINLTFGKKCDMLIEHCKTMLDRPRRNTQEAEGAPLLRE